MCNLFAVERCRAAIQPRLSEWSKQYAGQTLVAYFDAKQVQITVRRTIEEAEAFRDALAPALRESCIVLPLRHTDKVLML